MDENPSVHLKKDNFESSHSTLAFYQMIEPIGKGAYGKVSLALHRQTKKPVAIKIIDKTALSPAQIDKLQSEVRLLTSLQHDNIVRLLEVIH